MVVSRDGYVLWARSSKPAFKSGVFFKTSGPPIEVPPQSRAIAPDNTAEIKHAPGVWFPEETKESKVVAEQYDFAISLLLLGSRQAYVPEEHEVEDTYQRFERMK